MSLVDQISEDLKAAMKAKAKDKLEALRAIKSAFLLAKADKGATAVLSEDEELKIIQKLIRQRKESAEVYKAHNRPDLYHVEISEAEVISAYLPRQLSDKELSEKITAIIARTGASSMKDMGKVMAIAGKELSGKADGKAIASKVRELLEKTG